MIFLGQPWSNTTERLGDQLEELLRAEEPGFDILRICVAYVKTSGLLRLAPALRAFLDRGNRVEVVVGVDDGVTSRQALQMLLQYSSESYVFSNPRATFRPIFHPKVYLFSALRVPNTRAVAFAGSSNLTAGGLYTNYEANIRLDLDLGSLQDRAVYFRILDFFNKATNLASGNSFRLDQTLITRLEQAGLVGDESQQNRRQAGSATRHRNGAAPVFTTSPVPPPPPIPPGLRHQIPVRVTAATGTAGQAAPAAPQVASYAVYETFVMVLGQRDVNGQKKGFSADTYVPLEARDYFPEFWRWPDAFQPHRKKPEIYKERWTDLLVHSVSGASQLVGDVRLYYYKTKSEFRLNCQEVILGTVPGDLLVVHRPQAGSQDYEYEIFVVKMQRPEYRTFLALCTHHPTNSPKWWGYVR